MEEAPAPRMAGVTTTRAAVGLDRARSSRHRRVCTDSGFDV